MFSEKILEVLKNATNILEVLQSFQEGSIVLPYGQSEVVVLTRKTPIEVCVGFTDDGNMPVCQGDINKVGYTIIPDGFIVYGDISSNSAQLEYHVFFS